MAEDQVSERLRLPEDGADIADTLIRPAWGEPRRFYRGGSECG
ncbi:MAG: hypothetical protein QM692_10400 [Thermomicrobiales bacterium]